MKTAPPRVRGLVAVVGASVLTLAGPTTAAMALEDGLTGPLDEADQRQAQEADASTAAEADAGAQAQGPLEELCTTAFADQEEARTQCLELAGMVAQEDDGEDDGGEDGSGEDGESDDPFQQFCDTAFADQEDARTQCESFADTLAGDQGDDGGQDDDSQDDDSQDEGSQDDGDADEGDGDEAGDNPFMELCATAFADQPDARAQCEEFAGMFPGTGGGDDGANPFQQFCDEAFADNEDAHAQCSEIAQALGGDEGGEDDGQDDTDPAGAPDEGDDGTGGDDASGVMGDSVTSPAPDGSLAFTGVDAGIAGAVALALLALGGTLLRRVRLQA